MADLPRPRLPPLVLPTSLLTRTIDPPLPLPPLLLPLLIVLTRAAAILISLTSLTLASLTQFASLVMMLMTFNLPHSHCIPTVYSFSSLII
jgi:hypothetical protein